MDSTRTMIGENRRCPEYVKFFPTDQVDDTGQFGNRTPRGSTQVRWFGQDLSRAPDSGIGYSQDHRTQWAGDDRVEQDSYHPTGSQLMGIKHHAGGRLATSLYVDDVVRRRENRWDTPHKRALFGSDGPDSMTSGSDVVEAHVHGPLDDGYPIVAQSGLFYENDPLEEAWSPSRKLEDAVAQLQRDIADYRKELRFGGGQGPANPPRSTKRSGFTSTPVPRYSGKSSWEQHRQVFAAIACSNGWDGVTAALQLLSYLDGDALNVAMLIPESQMVVPGVLMNSLSENYGSPGRLAEFKRQLSRAFRRPDDDPSIFAIELETLARMTFADIDSSVQLQMVQDWFPTWMEMLSMSPC